jgi:hypothetical protein
MDAKTKYELIARDVKTPAGRARMASSFIQPLRSRRDYLSVGRKAFYVHTLLDGALSIYDKDPDITAYVVGEEGSNIVSVAKPKRLHFPLFEITANPEIPITQIRERQFDLIERSVDVGRAEIMAQEDTKVFAVMAAAMDDAAAPNTAIPVTGALTSNALADAVADIVRHDIRVANIFMNAKDYTDILKWDRDTLSPVQQDELLRTGLQAKVWGANIITSRIVEAGTVWVCGEPEFLGRIPVRTELTVVSADRPWDRVIGFSMFVNLGIGLHNGKAITSLTITR